MISSCKRRSCAACSTKPGGRSISSGYFLNYQRSPTIRSRKDDSGGQGDFFLYNTYLIKEQRRGIIFFDRSCPAIILSVAIRSNIWYSWDKGGNNLFFIYQRAYFFWLWRCGGNGRRESKKCGHVRDPNSKLFRDFWVTHGRFESCHRLFGSGFAGFWKPE